MFAHSPTIAKPSIAYLDDRVARLTGGLICPHCRRELRATDVVIDRDSDLTALRCNQCHQDLLTIERGQ